MLNAALTLPPDNRHGRTKTGVKRITNPHLKSRTTGSVSLVPAGWVKPGLPVRWRKRPAGIMSRFYTDACLDYSTNWNWPTAMDASRDYSEA